MAQRVVVTLSDDLDGGAADETVQFGVDGKSYEIDLSLTTRKSFGTRSPPIVGMPAAARPRRGKTFRAHRGRPRPGRGPRLGPVPRHELPARGRIPKHVYEASPRRAEAPVNPTVRPAG